MNNEKYNQIIDEAYENYENKIKLQNNWEVTLRVMDINTIGQQELLSQEEFINKCKTDSEFSEKWGLKIEERELSLRERLKLVGYRDSVIIESVIKSKGEYFHKNKLDEKNIPTKLITITYNNIKTEIYE